MVTSCIFVVFGIILAGSQIVLETLLVGRLRRLAASDAVRLRCVGGIASIALDELYVLIDIHLLRFLHVQKELLRMAPNLCSRPRLDIVLYLLPVLSEFP